MWRVDLPLFWTNLQLIPSGQSDKKQTKSSYLQHWTLGLHRNLLLHVHQQVHNFTLHIEIANFSDIKLNELTIQCNSSKMGNQVSLNLMTLSIQFTVIIFIKYFPSIYYMLFPDWQTYPTGQIGSFYGVKVAKVETEPLISIQCHGKLSYMLPQYDIQAQDQLQILCCNTSRDMKPTSAFTPIQILLRPMLPYATNFPIRHV